jgi:hypothetical protein
MESRTCCGNEVTPLASCDRCFATGGNTVNRVPVDRLYVDGRFGQLPIRRAEPSTKTEHPPLLLALPMSVEGDDFRFHYCRGVFVDPGLHPVPAHLLGKM